jgi:hypothetical protein
VTPRRAPQALSPDQLREYGLQVATRLIAVLRTGRAYAIDNPVFVGQLEQLLEALEPVLAAAGEARLTSIEGDLHLNGTGLPVRAASARFTEQMAHELRVRSLAGLAFQHGLAMAELELFMRFFLPSEVYKGHELARACDAHGIRRVTPLLWADEPAVAEGPAPEAPAHYQDALEACARALHDAAWLLGAGPPQGVSSHHYKRVVAPLVDAALAGQPISAGLADLDTTGDRRESRAVHLALLAVSLGAQLGLPRTPLAELGAAALLHGADTDDAGGAAPVSRALLRRARLAPLDAPMMAALRTVLPPAGGDGRRSDACPLAGILRLADAWVSLATQRSRGVPARTPSEALGMVLGPLAPEFHPALLAALVRALGLHPPGQLVELDDGSVARVAAADPRDPARPLVEPLTGPGASRLAPEARGAVVALPEGRRVERAVPFARPATGAGGFGVA